MIYKNFDIHGVSEIIPANDGAVSWSRFPKSVCEGMDGDGGRARAANSTGVELRFVIKSGSAKLVLRAKAEGSAMPHFHIWRGGLQGGWQDHERNCFVGTEKTECIIERSGNMETLERMSKVSGTHFSPEVVRVIFDIGSYEIFGVEGDVMPPEKNMLPEKTLLCYGSSITHGSNSYDMSHAWASVVAHKLGYDLINLGMAGCCRMEKSVIDHIADEGKNGKWDTAILELGINVLDWEDSLIYERAGYAVRKVASENPDKKIYVVSPFYCGHDFDGGTKADNWRAKLKEICEKEAFSNVKYIDGLSILPDMSYISADEVHPNIFGVEKIASGLYDILKEG